jgi:hypothetical protein
MVGCPDIPALAKKCYCGGLEVLFIFAASPSRELPSALSNPKFAKELAAICGIFWISGHQAGRSRPAEVATTKGELRQVNGPRISARRL